MSEDELRNTSNTSFRATRPILPIYHLTWLLHAPPTPRHPAALQQVNLTGFSFQTDERRAYPQGTVAAPVLGYMGVDRPLGGLETALNGVLQGAPGEEVGSREYYAQVLVEIAAALRDGRVAWGGLAMAKRLEVSKQTGIDFAIDKHVHSHLLSCLRK